MHFRVYHKPFDAIYLHSNDDYSEFWKPQIQTIEKSRRKQTDFFLPHDSLISYVRPQNEMILRNQMVRFIEIPK